MRFTRLPGAYADRGSDFEFPGDCAKIDSTAAQRIRQRAAKAKAPRRRLSAQIASDAARNIQKGY